MQVINTNVMSLNAQRNLSQTGSSLSQSIQRLSTGLRINSAKDDAAGLAISERFTTQIRGLNQAVRNANDGISLSQTAEGALGTVAENLQRIRELSVQSANATNSASDRAALQAEVDQLTAEIDRVATQTNFNGLNLLDGTFSSQQFQVGANAGETITIDSIASTRASALGEFQGFKDAALTVTGDSAATDDLVISFAATPAIGNVTVADVTEDASAIANAINSAGVAGLTAEATAAVGTGTLAALSGSEADEALSFTLNGTTISFQSGTTQATALANIAEEVNNVSAATGVSVTDTGSGLEFTAADGRNITFGALTGATTWTAAELGVGGLLGTVEAGGVDVTYRAPDDASVTTVTFTHNGVTGGAAQSVGSTGTAMSDVDISTVSGANDALTSVDAALDRVNSIRADLGAIQNRFESTIANLQTTSENLSASRSRILDADFAAETANLTRAQILQQAGTAMLAQANAIPQNVLSLLQ